MARKQQPKMKIDNPILKTDHEGEQDPITGRAIPLACPNGADESQGITPQPVTFPCSTCGNTVTRIQRPGTSKDWHYCDACVFWAIERLATWKE